MQPARCTHENTAHARTAPFADPCTPPAAPLARKRPLKGLALPHLDRLLARLSTADASPAGNQPHPPHERALAQALGLGTEDGLIPWAAWHRLQQGNHRAKTRQCGLGLHHALPVAVTTDHITLHDPAHLGLDEAASRELLAIVAPWFAEDGITLHYDQPTRWLASSPCLPRWPPPRLNACRAATCAWMPNLREAHPAPPAKRDADAALHPPFNDARTAQGLPAVNSFWGTAPAHCPGLTAPAQPPQVADAPARPSPCAKTGAPGPMLNRAGRRPRGRAAAAGRTGPARAADAERRAQRTNLPHRAPGAGATHSTLLRPQRFMDVREQL